ncbi:MAG TPA: ClbS/DfsB family four-helix bundle protein [Gemmatimonadales bacterium]
MDQMQSKDELIEVVRQARADLEQLIADAGEERMTEPNAFGQWTFKDVIAHLTGWRMYSAARMEAATRGGEPVSPWPAHPDPDNDDVDVINRLIWETNRDRPVADVLRESRETFDRLEAALAVVPEEDLFDPNRFSWLSGWPLAAVIDGMREHFYVDHAPEIRAWLGQRSAE